MTTRSTTKLTALLVLGCTSPQLALDTPANLGGPAAPLVIWLDRTSPGYAAQQDWDMPLAVLPSFEWHPRREMQAACGSPSGYPDGCTRRDDGQIILCNDVGPDRARAVMWHEIGHLVGHDGGHLPQEICLDVPSDHVMCEYGSARPDLTAEDRAWAKAGVVSWQRNDRGTW